jgi:uncharacterized protein with HEPN domain
MSRTETDRLRHMREAASFALGKSRADLDTDLMFQFAVVRALEIVGEAASRLTEATRAAHPEIPWVNIIGMRNRLAHGYFDLDMDIVWSVVTERLPPLIVALDHLLSPPTP